MKTTHAFLGCIAAAAMLSPSAWADVSWNADTGRGQTVNVSLPTAQARAVKSLVGDLQRSCVQHYVNLWSTTSRASNRAYPKRSGVSVVAAVTRSNSAAWQRAVGDKSIGLMCQGTPTEPHQTGEVRIGDLYFDFGTVNSGGTPTKMSRYFQGNSWYGSQHCEYTIPVTSAEMAAFKAFYLARANQAIVDKQGNAILPEFDSNGATRYGRNGWVEGCSAASSSSLDKHWTKAFRASLSNIQAVGRRLHIPEMANATPEMATAIESLTTRLGIKQQCSPQGMVRRGVYANNERVGMMTILNDPNTPSNLTLHNQWDQKYGDANGEAWSGMAPVTIIPDLPSSSRGSKNFNNVRISDPTKLNTLFNRVH
jgi:hypothetical protein